LILDPSPGAAARNANETTDLLPAGVMGLPAAALFVVTLALLLVLISVPATILLGRHATLAAPAGRIAA